MANLIITNVCNLSCPYCFASESRRGKRSHEGQSMSVSEFARTAELIDEPPALRFCGGEPTLHPQYTEMLDVALAQKDRGVFLMTNGMWPAAVRKHFAALPPEQAARVRVLFNCLEPSFYRAEQRRILDETISLVNPNKTMLGVTLYKIPFDPTYLVELARRHGIKTLRYSAAAPSLTGPWALTPETDFRELAKIVHRLIVAGAAAGMNFLGDCGYVPPCAFTKEELADILSVPGPTYSPTCVSTVDIGPGGAAWRCYGLFNVLRAQVASFNSANELDAHFARRTRLLDDIPLFAQCADCEHRRSGFCGQGCYAIRVRRALAVSPNAVLFPVDDDEALLDARPIMNRNVEVWTHGTMTLAIKTVGMRLQNQPLGPIQARFYREADGSRTVRDWAREIAPGRMPSAAERETLAIMRQLFDQDMIDFRRGKPLYDPPPHQFKTR